MIRVAANLSSHFRYAASFPPALQPQQSPFSGPLPGDIFHVIWGILMKVRVRRAWAWAWGRGCTAQCTYIRAPALGSSPYTALCCVLADPCSEGERTCDICCLRMWRVCVCACTHPPRRYVKGDTCQELWSYREASETCPSGGGNCPVGSWRLLLLLSSFD